MPPMGKGPGGKKMPSGGPKPKNMKKTLGTLLRYLGKYKVFLAIVLVLVVFNSFAMVAGSYFLKPLVNNYILPGDFAGLAKMLMVLGSIFLAGALSAYGYARLMVHVSQNTIRDIRRDLFNKMQMKELQAKRRGKGEQPVDLDEAEATLIESAAARIVTWKGLEEDGKVVEPTPENIKRIMQELDWVRGQVLEESDNAANFI